MKKVNKRKIGICRVYISDKAYQIVSNCLSNSGNVADNSHTVRHIKFWECSRQFEETLI